jgi:hypothetical protein
MRLGLRPIGAYAPEGTKQEAPGNIVKRQSVTSKHRVSSEVKSIGAARVKPSALERTTICIGARIGNGLEGSALQLSFPSPGGLWFGEPTPRRGGDVGGGDYCVLVFLSEFYSDSGVKVM